MEKTNKNRELHHEAKNEDTTMRLKLCIAIIHLVWVFSCVCVCVLDVPPGSLLDFLKSDEGNRVQLPKLIDFSAQVSFQTQACVELFKSKSFCIVSHWSTSSLCHHYCCIFLLFLRFLVLNLSMVSTAVCGCWFYWANSESERPGDS